MGNKFRPLGNGPARSGRNGPSFIVCALFIGLCIVSVSYYNLSNQYTKLYDSMTEMVKQQKLLEAHLELKKNEQLDEKIKEQEFQKNLQTKIKELDEAKGQSAKSREELKKKGQELTDSQARIKELETLKTQLNEEIVKQKEQIDELTKNLFKGQAKNQNDIMDKAGLDPKRKIVDNQPINAPPSDNDTRSKEAKTKEEDRKPAASPKVDTKRRDPVVSLLNNKDKNQN